MEMLNLAQLPYYYKFNDLNNVVYDLSHRHIVAKWLNYNNVECKECLKNDSKI